VPKIKQILMNQLMSWEKYYIANINLQIIRSRILFFPIKKKSTIIDVFFAPTPYNL